MAQRQPRRGDPENSDEQRHDRDAITYFGVVNEDARVGVTSPALPLARDGTDEAIYNTEQEAIDARQRIGEQHGVEHLSVKKLVVSEAGGNELSGSTVAGR